MTITNIHNCNYILSLRKYKEVYSYYKSIKINDDIMYITHNSTQNMHNSMGLSWALYGECVTNTYTLSFKAKTIEVLSSPVGLGF